MGINCRSTSKKLLKKTYKETSKFYQQWEYFDLPFVPMAEKSLFKPLTNSRFRNLPICRFGSIMTNSIFETNVHHQRRFHLYKQGHHLQHPLFQHRISSFFKTCWTNIPLLLSFGQFYASLFKLHIRPIVCNASIVFQDFFILRHNYHLQWQQ